MFPPNFTIEFIQGYQDKKNLYDQLPLTGKLNIDTKNYSKKYLPSEKCSHHLVTDEYIYQ